MLNFCQCINLLSKLIKKVFCRKTRTTKTIYWFTVLPDVIARRVGIHRIYWMRLRSFPWMKRDKSFFCLK